MWRSSRIKSLDRVQGMGLWNSSAKSMHKQHFMLSMGEAFMDKCAALYYQTCNAVVDFGLIQNVRNFISSRSQPCSAPICLHCQEDLVHIWSFKVCVDYLNAFNNKHSNGTVVISLRQFLSTTDTNLGSITRWSFFPVKTSTVEGNFSYSVDLFLW